MTVPDEVVHVALPDQDGAACAATVGVVIDWAEATDPAGRHFTCVECHKAVAAGDRHWTEPA